VLGISSSQRTLLLGVPDDPESRSVLDAPAWILELGLAQHLCTRLFRQFRQTQLCVSCQIQADRINRQKQKLTSGVLPTAPTNPSTGPFTNPRAAILGTEIACRSEERETSPRAAERATIRVS
jgi:hypothetical protein